MCKNSEYIGHHGTSQENAESILATTFNISKSDYHWLGDGVYFFVNDRDMAIEWCRLGKKFINYSVLQSCVVVKTENVLDLNSDSGSKLFHGHREIVIERLSKTKYGINAKNANQFDGKVINELCVFFPYKIIYNKFYLRIIRDKVLNLSSRIPNCNILCVRDIKCICDTSICIEGVF